MDPFLSCNKLLSIVMDPFLSCNKLLSIVMDPFLSCNKLLSIVMDPYKKLNLMSLAQPVFGNAMSNLFQYKTISW